MMESPIIKIPTSSTVGSEIHSISLFNNRLPPELREQIYDLVIRSISSCSHSATASVSQDAAPHLVLYPNEPSLTSVCHLWRQEALPMYYKISRYRLIAPLRLSSYGELYNPLIDQERIGLLPCEELLARVRLLRVEFVIDRFARGSVVKFGFDVDWSTGVAGKTGNWDVKFLGVEARNTYDPGEWREKARLVGRYLEWVLRDKHGIVGESIEKGQLEEKGNEVVLTRKVLRALLCVDFREDSGRPTFV